MRKKVIVCADDLGLTSGINQAIEEAFLAGCISMTTVMPNAPYFEEAAQLVKKYKIPCGVHLTVATEFDREPLRPLLKTTPTDAGGFLFPNIFPYLEQAKAEDICAEFEAQIEKVMKYGITPTHIDSHMHVFSEAALVKTGRKYQLPCRDLFELHPGRFGSLFHVTTAGNTVEGKCKAAATFLRNLPADVNVMVVHPTKNLDEMKEKVSPAYEGRYYWQTELRFQDLEVLNYLNNNGLLQGTGLQLSTVMETSYESLY